MKSDTVNKGLDIDEVLAGLEMFGPKPIPFKSEKVKLDVVLTYDSETIRLQSLEDYYEHQNNFFSITEVEGEVIIGDYPELAQHVSSTKELGLIIRTLELSREL